MKIVTYTVLFSLVFFFSGCTTKEETGISEIKNQLTLLQDSLSQENQRVTELEFRVEALSTELQSLKTTTTHETQKETSGETSQPKKVASENFVKKVQTALVAAGFDPGSTDGKTSPQTIQAIKNFQEANGLKVDGIVGVATWEKLQGYLETK